MTIKIRGKNYTVLSKQTLPNGDKSFIISGSGRQYSAIKRKRGSFSFLFPVLWVGGVI